MNEQELRQALADEDRYFCLRTPDCPVHLYSDGTLGYTTLNNGLKHSLYVTEIPLVREITRAEVDQAHDHIDQPRGCY